MTELFLQLSSESQKLKTSSYKQRKLWLATLKTKILEMEDEIYRSLLLDFKKNKFEAWTTEIRPTIEEINHTISHLKKWMKAKRVKTPWLLFGSKSEIHFEAKGVCLIIAPWNYPFQLAIAPLIAAIAAGNSVVLKPSELTPNTANIIKKLITSTFKKNHASVVLGGVDVAQKLLDLPFDHIFFTGSTTVGRIVAQAAAKHLSTVTLELGGKSPTLITDCQNLRSAAEKILWGKWINNGQTCVAPDYILIERKLETEFISHCNDLLSKWHEKPCEETHSDKTFRTESRDESTTGFISDKYSNRINELLHDAKTMGFNIVSGPQSPITLLTGINMKARIMREEIFGPILPIIAWDSLEEAFSILHQLNDPLALYIFCDDKNKTQNLLTKISSGGVSVNCTIYHLANPDLPFGGIGKSGQGNYHGEFGFRTFSHTRAVFYQKITPPWLKLLLPPYDLKKIKIIRALTKS